MSTITEARALLQRVREGATPGEWEVRTYTGPRGVRETFIGRPLLTLGEVHVSADATLIVLLAGNPALLDAIDGMLALATEYGDLPKGSGSRFIEYAERIASALVQQGKAMGL